MSAEITKVRPGALKHGSFESFTGTETIPGCDCRLCEAGYKARLEARKNFSYYRAPTVKLQAKDPHRRSRKRRTR